MPIEFGPSGLKIQDLNEIQSEVAQSYRDEFGPSFDISAESEAGKESSIYDEREALLQEAIQYSYSSAYRNSSQDIDLDRNLEVTGQTRQGATRSEVVEYLRGTPSQSIVAEAMKVTVDQTGEVFFNPSAETLGSISAQGITSITHTLGVATATISGGHSFPEDSFVFIEGAEQSEYNKLTEITGVTGTTFDYLVDSGTVSPATGSITSYEATPVSFESQETGPIVALAGTLINIAGSAPGVVRAENIDDAIVGANQETDAEAKTRADESVNIAGGGFREAIIARLLNVSGVVSATVFANVSNVIDPDGRPPGAVECFVAGGTDEDVSEGVFNSVSDGIQTFGNVDEVITDSQGQDVDISFSRLDEVELNIKATLTTNIDIEQGPIYPVNGDDQIKSALALIEFNPGQDIWEEFLKGTITSQVPGIITMTILFDVDIPVVNSSTIVIAPTEFGNIDTPDVEVNST